MFFFFFSSRRRHTRFSRDWSSDVCSSDLFCGTGHAVGVDSGLSALELALRAAEIGPGDEVITQANTFIATVAAILAVGARPVLSDCDEQGGIDPAAVEARSS